MGAASPPDVADQPAQHRRGPTRGKRRAGCGNPERQLGVRAGERERGAHRRQTERAEQVVVHRVADPKGQDFHVPVLRSKRVRIPRELEQPLAHGVAYRGGAKPLLVGAGKQLRRAPFGQMHTHTLGPCAASFIRGWELSGKVGRYIR